ncbi:site-specific integrase [Nocardia sp. NPDC051570]|uniref:site-specific integrase n=1 Tax=Nocardia sp. NPDC051570 TaxID=3364324 RepID=UPI0037A3A3DE
MSPIDVAVAQCAPALDEADRLWAEIPDEFLAVLGWSPDHRVITFPQDHPLLGWKVCEVTNCDMPASGVKRLCGTCQKRWSAAGEPSIERFTVVARPQHRDLHVGNCVVRHCQRPWRTAKQGLCHAHLRQRKRLTPRPTLDAFLARSDVRGLPAHGPCEVVSCHRDRDIRKNPYCRVHANRWTNVRRTVGDEADEMRWRRKAAGIGVGAVVSLRGLPDRVVAELLFGLHARVLHGCRTIPISIRSLADQARTDGVDSLEHLDRSVFGVDVGKVFSGMVKALSRRSLTPETERLKDVWDIVVFGHHGLLHFTGISQRWLREATKIWAYNDIPRRRGTKVADVVQAQIHQVAMLSDSLRLQRQDEGTDPARLGRVDISAFLNRAAFLHEQGVISFKRRLAMVRDLRRMFSAMRGLGLTRPGQPLHGLPDDFELMQQDIPSEPEENDDNVGRDLPIEVMRHLCLHLDVLEQQSTREIRVTVELLIDTGRRPDEICQLPLDCLERDGDGKPLLVFDNWKNNRPGRRLPIQLGTAALVEGQQQRVRTRFPNEPVSALKLLPTSARNPHGRRAISDEWVSERHRGWVNSLPDVLVPLAVEVDGALVTKMLPFDKRKIFPYAYRHTYAQRHADAGVDIDVLRELMDHRLLSTTQGYYRVGADRRRAAVDRVTTMQFDRHGNRIWRAAKALLDSEHLRRAVGEIAVPYGSCSEPTNVAANGQDCPVRFRCVGCAHFSTDVSYLPDLEAYLSDLLRSREWLRIAFSAADEWAKAEAMPSDDEIARIRRLISSIKADVDELSDEDRAHIDDAVSVVRRARNSVVGLGLPRIRQPLPDVRPDRTA